MTKKTTSDPVREPMQSPLSDDQLREVSGGINWSDATGHFDIKSPKAPPTAQTTNSRLP